MYEARVYKVMIASPSDVANERESARKAIHYWNTILADETRIVLLPIGWETHAHPMMGERPQEVINKQLLRDCDLLVAVFWTRLGSPTGEAASGTAEEIEKHLSAGKPAMIYFSNAPVHPDSIDETQYAALREFRAAYEKRGLIETFDSISEFQEKFGRQLIQRVLSEWGGAEQTSPAGKEALWKWNAGTTSPSPVLSEDAENLLAAAAKDVHGVVLRARTFGGLEIQTNGRNFVEDRSPRNEARWESALRELVDAGLLEDRGYKGEVFAMTNKGFLVAELGRG